MANPPPLDKKRILFVDDRYEINKRYIDAVSLTGAECTYVSNIISAINHLTEEKFDFAVIDLHMGIPNIFPENLSTLKDEFLSITGAKREMNAGQMIGVYINTILSEKIKFIYFSAVASNYIMVKNGEPYGKNICYDKYIIRPDELSNIIMRELPKS